MESNNNTAVATTNTFAAIAESAGIKIDTTKAKNARRNLSRIGAQSANLTDDVIIAANAINNDLTASENNVKHACYIAGALRLSEAWKEQKDDAGKPFKSENAFLKGILPGYQTSTVTLYADVGATIYIPAARGEFKDLPGIEDMGPSNAKFLLNAVKNADKRKLLPAALDKAKEANGGKLTQRAIQSAIKDLNGRDTNPQTGASAQSAGTIADELSGGSVSGILAKMITFAYNGDGPRDGDLTAIVKETDVKDFIGLLLKARDDKDTAAAVCDTLYRIVKATK